MSQRKEKYLRRTLEQYDGIARDVDHLNNRVPTIARDLEMVKDRQASMDRQRQVDMARIYTDVDRAIAQERRRRRRDHRAARRANLLAFLALIVAIAALLTIIVERVELAEEEKAAAVVKASAPACITIPELAEIVTLEHDAAVTEDELAPHYPRYVDAIPLTEEEQMHLYNAADAYDIWYPLAVAMVEVETDFRNIAGDGGDSIGYLQVNKNYHTELMEQVGATDLWEPRDNFRTGLAYLAQQIERYDTIHMALMAYNMGPTGASKVWEGGVYESEYSREVMECAERWAEILGW